MKILVVDDSMMSRMSLIKNIPGEIRENAQIIQAADGKAGVDAYKEHRPQIVFLDLTMPVLDGYAALQQILRFDPEAKVVIVSADAQPKAVERVMKLGAKKHIEKMIDENVIADVFRELGL